jgi:hypothetical protein
VYWLINKKGSGNVVFRSLNSPQRSIVAIKSATARTASNRAAVVKERTALTHSTWKI